MANYTQSYKVNQSRNPAISARDIRTHDTLQGAQGIVHNLAARVGVTKHELFDGKSVDVLQLTLILTRHRTRLMAIAGTSCGKKTPVASYANRD